MFEISIKTTFNSAHQLVGYNGSCENLHGHNWVAEVFVRTEKLDSMGMGIDYMILKDHTEGIVDRLDHKNINKVPPFDKLSPTSENIAKWVFDELSAKLNSDILKVFRVNIKETENFSASYFGE